MSIQFRVERTFFTVVVAFILLCLLPASCLLGGYGLLMLLPQATPTMSLVESVRATATAQALEIAAQPTPTSTPTLTPQLRVTDTPYPTLEPTATNTPEAAAQPTATDTSTSLPSPTPQPRAANTPVPTPTNITGPPPTPPPRTSLTRGPYLQWVRPHSIIIVWETSGEVDSAVEYGPTEAYGSTTGDYTWTTRHAITLTGLSRHATYHYRVGTSAQVLSGDSTFRTAAGPGQTSFTFAVIGDTHSGVFEFPRRQAEIDATHRANMDRIAAIAPDFYLHVGDLVEEGSDLAAWNDFFAIEGSLMRRITMFPTLGNHERNHQNYFDLFHLPHNERWYSFDYGHAHFICLELDSYADTSPGGEQYLWLQSDLASTAKTWTFVFFHFPAYNSGYYGSDPGAQAYLVPLFQQYGVDVVFSGHQHNYQRNVADGITYFVTGGGGQFTNSPGFFAWTVYTEETRHILKLSITGNTLSGVAIRPDGSQFDPFTLTAD